MKTYYECRITCKFRLIYKDHDHLLVKSLGWFYSRIENDIVKFYATRHYNDRMLKDNVVAALTEAAEMLRIAGITVLHEKVEHVIYDKRAK